MARDSLWVKKGLWSLLPPFSENGLSTKLVGEIEFSTCEDIHSTRMPISGHES